MREGGLRESFSSMKPKTKKKNPYHVGTRREGGQIKLKTGVSSVTNQNPNQNIQ